jgi:hypothetical protein
LIPFHPASWIDTDQYDIGLPQVWIQAMDPGLFKATPGVEESRLFT